MYTGTFQDVLIESHVSSIKIHLIAIERYSSLSGIQLFIGREGIFQEQDLVQDSSRTWLIVEENYSHGFQFDFIDVRGSAHLGLQSSSMFNCSLEVKELAGDYTGTVHVGGKQNVAFTVEQLTILPFNVQTYKVCYSYSFCGFYRSNHYHLHNQHYLYYYSSLSSLSSSSYLS